MKNRLDIHKQIKGYYSLFFSGEYELRPVHTSLYMFLLNQNNRAMWAEWFKCPFDLGMAGSGINSKNTYYKIISDLERFGLIEYQKGINEYKAPKIKIIDLSSVPNLIPLSEPLSEPLSNTLTIPLSEPLSSNIIRLITNNFKLITDNIENIIKTYKKETKEPETQGENKFDFLYSYISTGIPENLKLDDEEQKKYASLIYTEFLENSQAWIEKTCMLRSVDMTFFKNELTEFLSIQIQKDTYFKGYNKLKEHFINYLNKKNYVKQQ